MPYDALGNYIPGDEPSIDQMQYELAKKGQAPRPLDKVTEHFKNIVTQFNPIMMPKVMQDVGTIGTNIASTIISPYADILSNVQASGAAGLHRLAGNEQAALEAEARQRQVTPSGLMREPTLPVVREFEQGLGKAFEASKLPPMGPGSGMPGSAPVSPRPMFTPNDLRVVGAEATRVGRQIGDIPTDFANAQSGFQRIDPVTGQPVIGARIQSGVDRLGDIMEQRKMQGLTPIPGLPAALQPETSMYAVRPQGSRLTTPVVPETARGFSPPIDPANDMFKEVVGLDPERAEVTPTLLHSLNSRVQFNDVPNDRDAINGFRSFMQNKAQEMYPEAETPRQALEIFNAMHYDTPSRHAVENKMFDEFIQTPEGQQLLPNAVSSDEMAKRHDAATEGLKNMWGKYLIKNLGTEGNPLVKMAAEKGLTYLPAEDVLRIASEEAYTASANRQKAGMPVQGSFAQPIANLKQEIEAISLPLQNAANAEQSLGQAAHIAGVDPASVPEYLEARKNAAKLNKQKNELQKKLDNLTLASAYEVFEDASVKPAPAEMLLKEMQPSERGFYPGLKEAAIRGEKGYKTSIGSLEYMGFVKAADNFYNDVLQGKIPADRAATYPVDKYIRENAEARIKVEQAAKANFETYKNDVLASLKQTADALPADKKFGNVGVVELTKDTPINDANREVAASTEALDICIGEGGSGTGTRNLFTGKKNPNRTAIVNLLTGEPNPNASRHTSSYVESLQRGEQLPMFRDIETGMPIAALQFHVASSMQSNGQPMFNIGYASGAGNGRIEAKYADGIRDYLNTRANDIAGIGNNLEDNTGIYDTTNRSSLSKARKSAQVSENEMKAVDWNSMPRFVTADDVKQAVKGVVPATVVPQQTPAIQEDIGQLQAALVDNIDFVINEAIQDSNLDAPEELERRLGITFSAMQSQYFPTLLTDPISSLNRALEYLEYEIDRRSNNVSEISQEMAVALTRYANELETARNDLVSQQQRAQQPAPQMQPAEQLRQAMAPRLFAGNSRVVNETLSSYSDNLQRYAANQVQNGMSPIDIANGIRDAVNIQRNLVLSQPTEATRNFTPDELGEYVSELRQMIDNTGRWIETQQQQPQRANLPAEVQQNIDQRNQDISNAYLNALIPNTNIEIIDQSLSEFADLLHSMSTNLYGAGFNTAEIVERLQDRIRTEITELSNTDRVMNRGLNVAEADTIRSRLNTAYGDLTEVREAYQVPRAPQAQSDQTTRRLINDSIQAAFTPNTGSQAVDAYLSQYSDTLVDQLASYENQGIALPDVITRLREEIQGHHDLLVRAVHRADGEQITGLTHNENIMARERLTSVLRGLEFNVTPPEQLRELPVDFFEPDDMHGANEPYTMQSAVDMARDVFEQERIDTNNFDIPSIEQSIYALREGLFDDARIRRLSENQRQSFSEDVAFRLQNMLDEMRDRQAPIPVPAQPATAPYVPIARLISSMTDQAITADMPEQARTDVQNQFELLTDTNSPEELRNIVSLARSYAMGPWENFSDVQREWLARNIEEYIGDNPPPNTPPPEEPPQRRGPFRPGGASAVRGVPLGNLNIQPSITAEAFRGPDRQPVSNFLQQVKSMPGVTQEGLKTGLMAFENMDPSRQMTKAEFARELLPSSYDIVDLAGTATVDRHTMDMIESMIQDDPDASRDVFESMEGLTDIARKEIVDYLNDNPGGHFEWHMFSDKAKKSFAKSDGLIKDAASFLDQWANSQEHLKEQIYTEQYGQDINENGYKYEDVQRLTIPSMGDEYGEFGVTHPDQSGMYHHYDNAPEGTIGHFRGTYNPADPLELKTVTNETLTTKPGSYVIEEIQSDAQKGSAQKAHLHQVHGVLFKAAIQKALELGADTVYLPTAKVIASERPSVAGWEARPDDRGLTMQVPIRKDTTSKFAPIYDQAIVKEGLKPLLKIPGVTSKMVNGYHEISFTPEAKEHILNGPGQTIPGYKKGGRVHQFPSVEQMKHELMMRRA